MIPAQGPHRSRPVPGHDARGSSHRPRPRRTAQLQAAAADLVSDPRPVFRDEPRPQERAVAGTPVHRCRGRLSVSISTRPASYVAYSKHHDAWTAGSSSSCGTPVPDRARRTPDAMGGSQSHEFMVKSDAGEDLRGEAAPPAATRANFREKAIGQPDVPPSIDDPEGELRPRAVSHARLQDYRRHRGFHQTARDVADEEPGGGGRWRCRCW